MTKPVIVTRASNGSALTWAQGDTNLTNLRDATIAIKAGTGGTDVVSDLNGTVTLVAGTNISLSGDNTAKTVTINNTASSGINDVVQDTTPQLGGDLDVNGKNIVSTSNGDINLVPNGTGKVVTPATLNASILASTQSSGDEGGQIELALAATNSVLTGSVAIDINQSQLRIFETGGSNRGVYINLANAGTGVSTNLLSSGGGISDVVADTTPQLGGDLDVNGHQITSNSNGNITIVPNGSGNIQLTPGTGKITLGACDWPTGTGTSGQVLTTSGGTGQLSWTTVSGGGDLVNDLSPQLGGDLDVNGKQIVSTNNGNIAIVPNGSGNIMLTPATGQIILGATNWPTTTGSAGQVLTTSGGTGQLSWTTITSFDPASPGTIGGTTPAAGTFTSLTSTGRLGIKEIKESVYDLGTTGGTIAPNAANGSVQKITLNSALTINAFTTPVAGQSLTLIIYGGTAYTSITSTMKFAGGVKTLTGTAGCVDILTIFFDGTTYFASLGKGFA